MKKIVYLALTVGFASILASCEPTLITGPEEAAPVSAKAIEAGFSYTQYADAACTTPQEDGNYIKYESKAGVVQFYIIDPKTGAEKILATGAGGVLNITPKRGSSPQQTVNCRMVNQDGSITVLEMNFTVFVPGDLPAELQLLLGESGKKSWTWHSDPSNGVTCWGNAGFTGNGAGFTATNVDGRWWGAPDPTELATEGQLKHSNTGVPTGEEDPGAYMTFNEDGEIFTYAPDGKEIRKGSYSIANWDASRSSGWELGKLKTSAASILFPFKINGEGYAPEEFDIMYLDANYMTLVYTGSAGSWEETTYWMFKNADGADDALTGGDSRKWFWADPEGSIGAWGNAGFTGNGAGFSATNIDGHWWGVTDPAQLLDQLAHSDTGVATGEEDADAYMIFDSDGKVNTYAADGTKIRGGEYKLVMNADGGRNNDWELGKLQTTAGSILFPFQINGEGYKPEEFDLMYIDADNMTLVYTGNAGSWGETTYWRFKAEK